MSDRSDNHHRIIRSAMRRQWMRRTEALGVVGCFLSGGSGLIVLPPLGMALIIVGLLWGWWLLRRGRRKRDWLARRLIRSIAKDHGLEAGGDPDGLCMLAQDLGIAPPGPRDASPLAILRPTGQNAMAMAGLRVREHGDGFATLQALEAVASGPIGWLVLIGAFFGGIYSPPGVGGRYRFEGMVAIVPSSRRFGEGVTVLPRRGIFESDDLSRPDDWEEIRLEDPVFTDRFRVFGPDQVESRYLLMPSDMQRILDLSDQLEQPVAIRFHAEAIYLAVDVDAPVLSLADASWNEDDLLLAAEQLESEIAYSLHIAKAFG